MSMFGASYEKCSNCGANIDAYDWKCSNCGSSDFKRTLKYCEICWSPAEMKEFECKGCGGSSFIHSKPIIEYCACPVPLIQGKDCARCNKELSPAHVAQFLEPGDTSKPGIGAKPISDRTTPIYAPNGPEKNFNDLITAQNRTTHAVRAFVRFLFIQLSGLTLTFFIWNVSNLFINQQECLNYGRKCSGNGVLQFLAVVTWIITVVWSSDAGWKELEKSKIN